MNVTADTFDQAVLERSRELPIVVDFWAAWCGPCRMLGPAIEQEAAKRDGKLELAKIDVDAEGELAARYGIQSIPTVAVFRDGEVVNGFVGAYPAATIGEFFDDLVAKEEAAPRPDAPGVWLKPDTRSCTAIRLHARVSGFSQTPAAPQRSGRPSLCALAGRAGPQARSLVRLELGEDDLAAGRLLVELADGQHLVDLRDEVLVGQAEHVDRRLAGVDARARVGDHLDELRHRRDVELLHLAGHHLRRHPGHAGDRADERREMHPRVAHRRHLDVRLALSS